MALLVGLPLHLALAMFLGALAFRSNLQGRRAAAAFLILGALVPFYVSATAWIGIFGEGHLFRDLIGSAATVGLVHALAQAPLGAVVCGLALRAVPRVYEEQALIDGSSRARAFVRAVLPRGRTGIFAAGALFTLAIFTDYTVSDILVVRTFAEEVYTLFAMWGSPAPAILAALPTFVLLTLLLAPLARAAASGGWSGSDRTGSVPRATSVSSRLAGAVLVLAALLLALVPVASLARYIEADRGLAATVEAFRVELLTSSWTAIAAGVFSAIAAPALAWALVRARARRTLFLAVGAALALPGPLAGIGLIRLLDHPGILGAVYDSPLVLVLAYVVRFFPVAILLVLPSLESMPRARVEAARIEGLSAAGVWARVLLPAAREALPRAALVVAAFAVGELQASLLVMPPGFDTVGRRFFSLVHYGLRGEAASLCLLGLACTLLPWAALVAWESVARKRTPERAPTS